MLASFTKLYFRMLFIGGTDICLFGYGRDVTDMKHIMQALLKEEEIHTIVDAVWWEGLWVIFHALVSGIS